MSSIDDLKFIHQRDKSDALGIAEKQYGQLTHRFELDWKPSGSIANVVLAGMGGSALSGLLSTTWPDYHVPFEIVRDYQLPAYVDEHSLVIVSSYSGNTEETLAALSEAEQKQAQIVCMAAGGKLQSRAAESGHAFILLPKSAQPRFGVLSSFKALVTILERAGLVRAEKAEATIHEAADFLRTSLTDWLPTVPTAKNPAKQLAHELMGRSVVVYAGPKLFPAAYKWKISFNENAKNVAWCSQYPEFNHNEFMGWVSHPVEKPYAVIELRSNLEHERIQKRFEVSERLLSGRRPAPEIVQVGGGTILEQLLWAVVFGDFVSLYLALLNNVDPSPVDLVEKLKKELE